MPNPNLRRKASNKKHANKNRGEDTTSAKKNNSHTVGPVLLGFFLFVVVGSAIIGIFSAVETPLIPSSGGQ